MANPASTTSRSGETDPGAGVAHSSAKAAGEVIAVTLRDDFLLELGESLGGQVAVHPVDSFAAALERVSGSRRAQLLAVDSRDVADLRSDVERAHAQMPHVPVIVFAASDAEKTVAGALKSSAVFAVLPVPVDRRKTAAIFEGALADATAKRAALPNSRGATAEPHGADADRAAEIRYEARAPLAPEPEPLAMPHRQSEPEPPGGSKVVWIGAAAAAVVALAGGAYWLHSRGSSHAPAAAPLAKSGAAVSTGAARAPAAAPAVAPAETPQVALIQGTLDSLLEKARQAMRERRYTEPASNCALLYYRSALGVDPTSGEARDGMARLATLLKSRFDEAIAGSRLDEAAGALANLKTAAPRDPRLGALESRLLEAEIGKAFSDGNVERATSLIRQAQQSNAVPASELARFRTQLAQHQDQNRAKHLADLFTQRIREGRLAQPANDNARYYLQQLKKLAPDDPVAQRGTHDLVAAFLRKAREATITNEPQDAQNWIAQARSSGMTSAEYAAYQRDLATARQRAAAAQSDRLIELARSRLQSGQLTDPASDSAAYYLSELDRAHPGDPTAASIGRELATRLIERATSAARAGNASAMSADLALAKRWGADPALLQAVQDVLTGRSGMPSRSVRAASSVIPPGFVPTRTRYVAPEYPEQALDEHISGSVTVEFTVDVRGRPRDVRVVDSDPEGMFDRAAIHAVSAWRFKPAVFNGVPTEIPTRMIIRFKAPN